MNSQILRTRAARMLLCANGRIITLLCLLITCAICLWILAQVLLPVKADFSKDFMFIGADIEDTKSVAWSDWDNNGHEGNAHGVMIILLGKSL